MTLVWEHETLVQFEACEAWQRLNNMIWLLFRGTEGKACGIFKNPLSSSGSQLLNTQTVNAQWRLLLQDTNEAVRSLGAVKQSLSSSVALWLVQNANPATAQGSWGQQTPQ